LLILQSSVIALYKKKRAYTNVRHNSKKPTELHITSVKTSSKNHFTDKLTQLLLIYSKKLVWNRFWHKEKDALSVRGEEHLNFILNFILRND